MHSWVSLAGSAVHLALSFVVLTRRPRSPLTLPLGLLCLDMFAWNAADAAREASGSETWHAIDCALSPQAPALALHVVASFVGKRRAYARVLAVSYAVFGGLSLWGLLQGGPAWDVVFSVAEAPVAALAVGWLVVHLRQSVDVTEKSRARTMILAFAIAGVLGPTELLDTMIGVPAMGNLGSLVAIALVAVVAMRWRLLGREVTARVALYALLLAGVTMVAGVAVFRALRAATGVVVLGATVVTAGVLFATRELVRTYAVHRERTARLASAGRFAGQMAHDLKNPIAALKGALQFLREERARGRSLDAQHEFVDVMLEQVERLRRVVDDYQRIARVEPRRAPVRVNDVVRGVLALEPFAATPGIDLRTALADDLPECEADRDMIANAIENVVKNAVEAMPRGGELMVRTERASESAEDGIVVTVEDAGEGMDARQMEHAFDDFYTTKAHGSGLGLAFVRRVAHAHGGDVSLVRRAGGGTVVRMRLPVRREAT